MIDLTNTSIIILFFGGLMAGTVDAIAGGGGIISLPLLVTIGLPPHIALGTNKLQSSVGTLMATYHFFKKGLISLKAVTKGLVAGLIGASLGAVTAQMIHSSLLQKLLPFLMIGIFLYSIFSPKLGLLDSKQKLSEQAFFIIFGFILSFYDGFLGPGTGSFWLIAIVYFVGYNLAKATAYTKLFNLESNLVALLIFIAGNNVNYKVGFVMACGQIIGGKIGAHLVTINGAKLVRPVFLTVVFITIMTMLYKSFHTA